MNRLTDKEVAKALKSNCEGLKRAGIEPNMSDLRYIKLAEYENAAEHIEIVTNAPAISYQVAMIKQLMDGKAVRCKVNIADKPTKTIIDETSVYELSEESAAAWNKRAYVVGVDLEQSPKKNDRACAKCDYANFDYKNGRLFCCRWNSCNAPDDWCCKFIPRKEGE